MVRFDLRALLKGQMWSLIPIMVYISYYWLQRFGFEDDLWEIICPKFFVGPDLTFDPSFNVEGGP